MKYLYLIIVILVFASNTHAEQPLKKDDLSKSSIEKLEVELNSLREEIRNLNTQVNQSNKKIQKDSNELKADLSKIKINSSEQFSQIGKELEVVGHLTSELKNTKIKVTSIDESVKQISLVWAQSSNIAKVGAIILLTGLLIEIIGATVLAGTHLVTEQKEVYTLKSTPPSNDLGMIDVNSEPRIDFLGSIASVMLFLGFVLQFSGTILVLSFPFWLAAIMVSLAVIPGTLIMYYLLGQSYNQSRSQKIKVILKNIKRNLTPSFGAKCEICSKTLKFNEAYVFWNKEPKSENHPYLYAPYDMHLGHQQCLVLSGKYEQPKNRHQDSQDIELHQKTVADFIVQDTPNMKQWWAEYRSHRAGKKNSNESISISEYTFLQVLKEIKKLKPNKHLHGDHISALSSL